MKKLTLDKILKKKEGIKRKDSVERICIKVIRTFLFPIGAVENFYQKRREATAKKLTFNEDTCCKFLNTVLPKMIMHCCEEPENLILISDCKDMGDINFIDFCGLRMHTRHRRQSKFFSKFSIQLREYILESYTIDGYKKFLIDSPEAWDKAMQKFDWGSGPYWRNYDKGVVFYVEKEKTE